MTRIEFGGQDGWEDITGQVKEVTTYQGFHRPTTTTVRLDTGRSLYATDLAAYWPAEATHRLGQQLAIKVEVPASRWQAFKARLKRRRGFGWLPVRTKWVTRFTGAIDRWQP